MRKTVTLDKDDKLHIALYHIGYSRQGESSIFILYTETKKVLYSLVIDCYEEEQYNITDQILSKWQLTRKLNMFVWTHPHDDHSLGVSKIIQKYCSEQTCIYTANVFGNYKKYSAICQENIQFLNSLNYGERIRKKWKINPLVHFPDMMDGLDFNGQNILQELAVLCIAPIPYLGGMQGSNKSFDCNQTGIGCIVKVKTTEGNINFLFAGDMDNLSIEALIQEADRDIPQIYNYIKIPHHGSKNGEKMIEFLRSDRDEKSEFASVSVYVKHKLPDKKVLIKYRESVNVIACTSDISEENYGIGVIRLEYNLSANEVKKDYFGAAQVVEVSKNKENDNS